MRLSTISDRVVEEKTEKLREKPPLSEQVREPITNSTHIERGLVSSSSLCNTVCTQLKVAVGDNTTNKRHSRMNTAYASKKKSKTLDFKHLSIFDNIYK